MMESHENEPGIASASVQHLAELVYAGMEIEAQRVLADGRANQKFEHIDGELFVALEPRSSNSASLDISIDTGNQVTCFPGKSGMTYEIFSKNPKEIEEDVRVLTRAVIAGHYSEMVNNEGRKTKIVAEWIEGSRVRRPRLNVLRTPRPNAKGWRSVTYKPY